MQGGAHRDRRKVRRAVTAHLHVIQIGERRDLPQRGDPAARSDMRK